MASIPQSSSIREQQVRDEWIAEIGAMADDVERWAKENDWDTKRETREMSEEGVGTYRAPVVRVQTMQGRVYFEPVARFISGGPTGRIELIGTPSFWQVVLIREEGRWHFYTEDFEDLHKEWTKEGFTDAVAYLLSKS